MLIQPYHLDELKFAWNFHAYICSRTYYRQPFAALRQLNKETLIELLEPYDLRVLESTTDEIEFRVLLSLSYRESIATAASKLKGRISKWINSHSIATTKSKTLARGFFAVTSGKSTDEQIAEYLGRQSEHHGYEERARPPVYVRTFEKPTDAKSWLACAHVVASIKFHIVLSTQWRHGVFGDRSGQAVADYWKSLERDCGFFIFKVSFVPDHVHIAVETNPSVSPADVVLLLMNAAQKLMWEQFQQDVINAKVNRLWQASAYFGSYGDLTSSALASFVNGWEKLDGD